MKTLLYALVFVAVSLWFLGPMFITFVGSMTPASERLSIFTNYLSILAGGVRH